MERYQATHKIYEGGKFTYLWDNVHCAVLTKSGNFFCPDEPRVGRQCPQRG